MTTEPWVWSHFSVNVSSSDGPYWHDAQGLVRDIWAIHQVPHAAGRVQWRVSHLPSGLHFGSDISEFPRPEAGMAFVDLIGDLTDWDAAGVPGIIGEPPRLSAIKPRLLLAHVEAMKAINA